MRPHPELTPGTDWFWKSRADGRLRVQACLDCGALDWLDGGRRIAPGGVLPVNPRGGQMSEGRLHGFGFIYEAMVQLRREAGERQVADASTAVAATGGGTPPGVLLLRRA